MISGLYPCLRGLARISSLAACPSWGCLIIGPSWRWHVPSAAIVDGRCRPVILHGYGGAKKEMPSSLAALAKLGWIPNGSGHGWLGVIPAVVDWTRLATHTWYRWTPGSCRPICPTRKAYSCSVSGFASHGMTSTSGTPSTAGCLLTKSKWLLVLIVISHRIQFERYLWTSALPTLICSLDPRNLPEAKLTNLSSKRSRVLWRSLRQRP